MSIGKRGDNLVFLISQPRAGSTLLQRMLGHHPDIHTVSEPWIMLHPCYALRSGGVLAEYVQETAQIGVSSFVEALPGRMDDYEEGLRRMYSYLYDQALANAGKSRFLDKTPRYYLIIPELYRIFPEARFVLLFRNPLAVLASILNTWVGINAAELYGSHHDLQTAPGKLLDGAGLLGHSCTVVHYEKLVSNPEEVLRTLCIDLGLTWHPAMTDYGKQSDEPSKWVLGDQATVYEQSSPQSQRADLWKSLLLRNPMWRNWARGYLRELGADTVHSMGYDYDQLRTVLNGPCRKRGIIWLDWTTAIKQPAQRGLSEAFRARVAAWAYRVHALWEATRSSFRKEGLIATVRRAVRMCFHRAPAE